MHLHLFGLRSRRQPQEKYCVFLLLPYYADSDCISSVLVILHFDDRETCFFTQVLDHGFYTNFDCFSVSEIYDRSESAYCLFLDGILTVKHCDECTFI